jgi:hypothetical protein
MKHKPPCVGGKALLLPIADAKDVLVGIPPLLVREAPADFKVRSAKGIRLRSDHVRRERSEG